MRPQTDSDEPTFGADRELEALGRPTVLGMLTLLMFGGVITNGRSVLSQFGSDLSAQTLPLINDPARYDVGMWISLPTVPALAALVVGARRSATCRA